MIRGYIGTRLHATLRKSFSSPASHPVVRRIPPTFRPLRWQRAGGLADGEDPRYSLEIPVPSDGFDEKLSLTIRADTEIAALLDCLRRESQDPDAEILLPRSAPAPSIVGELLARGHGLSLFGTRFDVLPADAAAVAAAAAAEDPTELDLAALLRRAKFREVQGRIASDPRRALRPDEWRALCAEHGVREPAEASQLLRLLHECGAVLHLSAEDADDGSGERVLLDPGEIVDAVCGALGFASPAQRRRQAERVRVEAELRALGEEQARLATLATQADAAARARADRVVAGGLALYAATTGAQWYLTYYVLSWDIMEPWTYFTTLGVGTFGYAYWLVTQREFEYSTHVDTAVESGRRRRLLAEGVEETRVEGLAKEIEERQRRVARLAGDSAPKR